MKKNGKYIKCKFCKNSFYVSASRLKGQHERLYCSKQCCDFAKKDNFNGGGFQKGHTAWNKGTKGLIPWNKGMKKKKQTRLPFLPIGDKNKYNGNQIKCFEFDKYQCTCCKSSSDLIVHHRDHNPKNHDFDNLVTLCRSCHTSIHNNEKNLRAEFKRLGFEDYFKDKINVVGNYLFKVFNQDGKFVRRYFYRNLVPTIGRSALADQIAGVNTQEMEEISIELGTGTTPPANGDTAMETPTHRKAIASAATSNNVATLAVNFTTGDLGGAYTFKEAGMLGDGSAVTCQAAVVGGTGILYSRVAISVAVSAVESLTVEFTYTFT